MSDKDLKKMSRAELVEMIISLRKKMDTLKMENAFLNEKLADEIIHLEEAGSIHDAFLSLGNAVEDAQKTADDYLSHLKNSLENADEWEAEEIEEGRRKAQEILEEAQRVSDERRDQAKETSRQNLKEAVTKAYSMKTQGDEQLQNTIKHCEEIKENTDREIEEKWNAFEAKINEILANSEYLKKIAETADQLSALIKNEQ